MTRQMKDESESVMHLRSRACARAMARDGGAVLPRALPVFEGWTVDVRLRVP
jgi:hypothetical protein